MLPKKLRDIEIDHHIISWQCSANDMRVAYC